MKKTTDIRERIAVRAYYAWLNGSTDTAETNWLAAEAIETAYAERRASSAKKAAETRKTKLTAKAPAEMLVAVKGRSVSQRLTAH